MTKLVKFVVTAAQQYEYACTCIVMLSVNLCVGRGKFEMLDDQIQGGQRGNAKEKKNNNNNKPNSVSILTKYCFKN